MNFVAKPVGFQSLLYKNLFWRYTLALFNKTFNQEIEAIGDRNTVVIVKPENKWTLKKTQNTSPSLARFEIVLLKHNLSLLYIPRPSVGV